MEYILKTDKISKKYGEKLAVNGVDMLVQKGDIYGLVGENGAGKTTLMRMICGMTLPTSGTLELFESGNLENGRKNVGVLIETPAIFPNMTARENLNYFNLLMGLEKKKHIDEVLEIVNLQQVKKKKAKNFSLGMKQRLGIAIALLGNPEFLILDEPINGLDVAGVKEVRDLLLDINQNMGTTILISSHILTELSRVATRFGLIRNGALEEEFTIEELNNRNTNCLQLTVSDIQEAISILNQMKYITKIEPLINNNIRIFGDVNMAGKINRQLVEGNVDVYSIGEVKEDLESYYLKKNGGVHNDSAN